MHDDSYGKTEPDRNVLVNSPGRRAALFAGVVVGTALLITVVFAAITADSPSCAGDEIFSCMSVNQYILIFAPTLLLAIGGITAFVKTFSVWRSGGPWKVWHATGWVLFIMMIVFASTAGGSLMT